MAILACLIFLLCSQEDEKSTLVRQSSDMLVEWLNQRKVCAFYTSFTADSLKEGTQNLMQVTSLTNLDISITFLVSPHCVHFSKFLLFLFILSIVFIGIRSW